MNLSILVKNNKASKISEKLDIDNVGCIIKRFLIQLGIISDEVDLNDREDYYAYH